MRRTALLMLALVPCVVARSVSPADAASSALPKGIRAMVIDGGPMPRRVVLDDPEVATAVYTSVTRAFADAEPFDPLRLRGRPCISIASFLFRPRSAPTTASTLLPEYADRRHWLYPAVGDQPAVLVFGRAVQVSPDRLQALTTLGVPSVSPAGATGCAHTSERPS